MGGRDARRRRILEGGQDRLALITGRIPNASTDSNDPDSIPKSNGQTSATYIEEEKPSRSVPPPTQHDQATRPDKNDYPLRSQIKEEPPFVRKPEPRAESSRAAPPPREEISTSAESSSQAVPKAVLIAADLAIQLAQKIPIGDLSAQQVSLAVALTEFERMLCTLITAALVILSYAGFPILGSRIFRRTILFRPLLLLLIANITLIARRLRPENQKNSGRGERDDNSSPLGGEFAWAEEAGRALELGLMLQSVMWALLTDCTVYTVLVVFFLAPFV